MSIDLEAIRSRSALYGDPEWRGKHSLWVQVACDDAVTLLAEVDRLRALVNDGIPWTCIYCGRLWLWPVSEPVDVLREHVIVCEKHPAARALPVIEAARGPSARRWWRR